MLLAQVGKATRKTCDMAMGCVGEDVLITWVEMICLDTMPRHHASCQNHIG